MSNKICIICRTEKQKFNDEHVIPDSIQGYYHIKSVCEDCNSKLGSKIDCKLTNHKFIEFQRFLLGIKGKSGSVPNPLAGTHVLKDDPNQKVQLHVDKDGKFAPVLLPKVPKEIGLNGEFVLTIDKRDEGRADEIIEKFLIRNGIPNESVVSRKTEKSDYPEIKTMLTVDIEQFKLAILKIAYEFTVDSTPQYFDDPIAVNISKILLNADFKKLNDTVKMLGNGLNHKIMQPFSHWIDLENNNHYLVLCENDTYGLICFVRLFNVFSLGFIMSSRTGFLKDGLLVGKNDISKKAFLTFNTSELIKNTYSHLEYKFEYIVPDEATVEEMHKNETERNFEIYNSNNLTPLFYADGTIAYNDIETKLNNPSLQRIYLGNTVNEMTTQIILDEELFLKHLPINKLYQVVSVLQSQYRISKL